MLNYNDPQQLISSEDEILALVMTRHGCAQSQRFLADFDKIQTHLNFLNLRWLSCDVDEHPEIANRFSCSQTPTVAFSTNNSWQGQISDYADPQSFVLQVTQTFTGC